LDTMGPDSPALLEYLPRRDNRQIFDNSGGLSFQAKHPGEGGRAHSDGGRLRRGAHLAYLASFLLVWRFMSQKVPDWSSGVLENFLDKWMKEESWGASHSVSS